MTWTMFLNHPKLRGETVRVEGASYLRTRNGKVYYHRDYFDLGAMLYENPATGSRHPQAQITSRAMKY